MNTTENEKYREANMKVAIIMGSDSDWDVMRAAAETLKEFSVDFDHKVVSAHRTPQDMMEFAKDARDNGYSVIIAGAGGAAHLPGMVASLTTLPVVGVPVRGSNLEGMDSLLSIVQMPRGIPVATVAINNSMNAALLAIRILAVSDTTLAQKMADYHVSMSDASRAKTLPDV
ncbi:MAG TPA: 5-(carboxyamino)imidazole ribonucleotide mutase [Gammaproteobacteria bacterium]|jgi:phosphoribosylaminoimidazole carboxylase PurE protein|nr:5-(carboxyamino)imidazole ribonucleotide mutase [Gammaproteobacteria bacterium]